MNNVLLINCKVKKIKKGQSKYQKGSGKYELVFEKNSEIKIKKQIKKINFTKLSKIKKSKQLYSIVNVQGKIKKIERLNGKKLIKIILKEDPNRININFWDPREFNLKKNQKIEILGVKIGQYQGERQLNVTPFTRITKKT